MRYMQRLSLHKQLLLLILIPLAGLLTASGIALFQARKDELQARHISTLTSLSVSASSLVHELQKERGMSAGFIGSEGREFRQSLRAQREHVDVAAQSLINVVAKLRGLSQLDEFDSKVKDALQGVSKAQDHYRTEVDQMAFGVPDVVGAYTAVITRLIDLTSLLASESDLSFINNRAAAYTSFIKSKERAGIERAILASTFAADEFQDNALSTLNKLISEQDAYIDGFLTLVDADTRVAYSDLVASPVFDVTFEYRSIALAKAQEGGFGINPVDWWRDQTAKIDELKAFEDGLAEELISLADAHASTARQHEVLVLVLYALVAIGALVASRLVRGTLLARLGAEPHELSNIARRIAAGDFNTDFSQYQCKDGSVIGDMKSMQDRLVARIESQPSLDASKLPSNVTGIRSRRKHEERLIFIRPQDNTGAD